GGCRCRPCRRARRPWEWCRPPLGIPPMLQCKVEGEIRLFAGGDEGRKKGPAAVSPIDTKTSRIRVGIPPSGVHGCSNNISSFQRLIVHSPGDELLCRAKGGQ